MPTQLLLLALLSLIGSGKGRPADDGWHRVSRDTFFVGERAHPFRVGERLLGYAFLHAAHSEDVRREQQRLSGANAVHFAGVARRASHLHSAVRAQSSRCSSPIVRGARWRTSRGVHLYTANRRNLPSEFIEQALSTGLRTWQCAVEAQHDWLSIGPIVEVRRDLSARDIDTTAPNGVNEIGFGAIARGPGIIALTTLWLGADEIVEFDMVFNDERYRFGDARTDRSVIDLLATAVHELGHANGLDDCSVPGCEDVTMFATSSPGETHKATPESDDIQGLHAVNSVL